MCDSLSEGSSVAMFDYWSLGDGKQPGVELGC